jgi:energy-converting hydrogenase A subunit M
LYQKNEESETTEAMNEKVKYNLLCWLVDFVEDP